MEKIETIKKHSEELINKMVDDAQVDVTEEESVLCVDIKVGEQAPTLIGRHGETIRALQKILEVIAFKQLGEKVDILINVNDYREKQTSRLQYIASEAAKKVQDRRAASYLRGFSSYERRVMHEYIAQNYPDLTSYSIGEGRDRRLVVDIKSEENQDRGMEEPEVQEE